MKERRKRRTIRVTIARRLLVFVTFYFILFTSYFSMLTFARYSYTGANDASIGIAKWGASIDTTSSNDNLEIVAGNNTQSYTFTVKSESEVATNYTVILSNLPAGIEVAIDGGNYQTPVNNRITYTDIGSFGLNEENIEHEHTLTFSAPLDSDIFSGSEISIDINFSQKI